MSLDRMVYGINNGKPFVMKAGESYVFRNDSPNRTLFVIISTGDGCEINLEIAPGRPIEINAGSADVTVEFVPLRPGY